MHLGFVAVLFSGLIQEPAAFCRIEHLAPIAVCQKPISVSGYPVVHEIPKRSGRDPRHISGSAPREGQVPHNLDDGGRFLFGLAMSDHHQGVHFF